MRFKLSDVIEINPKEFLKKGTLAKKVSMDKIDPFNRDVNGYEIAKYSGGTKFRNGDTIMARITPCLENGKTAKINFLLDDEVAFGSTEFIVFRNKDGITDEDYIYYLVCSPLVRDLAIKSMVGTSGRQRVQTDVIKNMIIDLPTIEEQTKIGGILKSIDDKIYINNKINNNLLKQSSAIFQSWFIDFKPFNGAIPINWKTGTLSELICILSGKRPRSKSPVLTNDFKIPIIGASSVMGYTNSANSNERILVIGRVGTHGIVQRLNTPCWTSDNTLVIKSDYYEYIYQVLNRINYKSMNRGSTQPLITQNDINKFPILIPSKSILLEFESLIGTLMSKYELNILENLKLTRLRNILLPKLMSGNLNISNIDI